MFEVIFVRPNGFGTEVVSVHGNAYMAQQAAIRFSEIGFRRGWVIIRPVSN